MPSRRSLLLSPLMLSLPAAAEVKPWRAGFLAGGYTGSSYHLGLMVSLNPGWKTYWRVPGAGGIPPSIAAAGSNLKSLTFDCPLPQRFHGEDGETIGYKNEVIFPILVEPADASREVTLEISSFIGVCEVVCIPVPLKEKMTLKPLPQMNESDPLLFSWREKVPKPGGGVSAARARENNGQVMLELQLDAPVQDIFVEGSPMHYYDAPQFSEDGRTARLFVKGAKTAVEMVGQSLRLTIATTSGMGVEQRLSVV